MDKRILLKKLPPFEDKWILVSPDQDVDDIVNDILDKHKKFARYYDSIALYFDRDRIDDICEGLYRFCKDNIQYQEEKENFQTTSIPAGILTRGRGDCKHYASFIGGVIDGINRLTGKKIDWCYRFASYNIMDQTPHHVFIVVNDDGQEIWIDPTPNAQRETPYWQIDKKVKGKSMPLYSNIGSINKVGAVALIPILTEFFSGALKNLNLGDQVPDYPIKSKNTLQKIMTDIQNAYPDPKTVEEAKMLLIRAQRDAQEAYAKGGSVNTTYGMIFDKVVQKLQDYINAYSQDFDPSSGYNQPGGNNSGSNPSPAKNNTLLYAGLGVGALLLLNKSKRVTGINNSILLLGIGGFLLFNFIKGGANSKRQYLSSLYTSESNYTVWTSAVNRMSDAEINDVYDYIVNYVSNNAINAAPASLLDSIDRISNKYNIFT